MRIASFSLLFVFVLNMTVHAEDKIQVLKNAGSETPSTMMDTWINKQTEQAFADWKKRYDTLKTPEEIAQYQKQIREQFVSHIGGFPERTELNAKVVDIVPREGYRVEKILFESQPKHYVTGLAFVPHSPKFQAPYPAVLIVCGHSDNGKAYAGYQTGAALAALHGMIGYVIDPICQGERYEHLNDDGSIAVKSTTTGHTLFGLGAILLGQNTARNEIWDGMRAIDYLQQRDDVNPDLIGCMGNSGGGTQAAYLMALDDRIKAASPSCYITSLEHVLKEIGPQDAEQIIFGQLDWGMEHSDFLIMRAPTPILMCTATQDFFSIEGAWKTYRNSKRIYGRLGYPERVSLTEADLKHGWNKPLRESAVQWMSRWLAGRDIPVSEPDNIQTLTDAEATVTKRGQVNLIAGAKSAFDLNHEEFTRLKAQREELWKSPENAIQKVRQIAGIRPIADIPAVKAKKTGETKGEGVTIEHWILEPTEGIALPALLYRPAEATQSPVLFVHQGGKQAEYQDSERTLSAKALALKGHTVLAVDVRGTGETAAVDKPWYDKRFGNDGRHLATAYLLGLNYTGLRAEDLLVSARWLLENEKLPLDGQKLKLISIGQTGLPALHASAVEPKLFDKVTLINSLSGWETIITSRNSQDQLVNCIHGALRAYDISDLIASLDGRVEVIAPVDAMLKK
ncbi:alpha/beta hydrolase family protein [Planctomicrobium sp. SH527]|uniref:alpha/beta hydrolase family protein n=1 Tax=Planctomicrobium sp. SH527 TaxID=3448123 RepID=UPI003F5C5766